MRLNKTCIFFTLIALCLLGCGFSSHTRQILKRIVGSDDYFKDERPNEDGPPVEADITFHVNYISLPKPGLAKIDLYVRQYWKDPRLDVEKSIVVYESFWGEIWKPDTFFDNMVEGKIENVPITNTLLKVSPGGKVWYVYRMSGAFLCESKHFKNGNLTCPIRFASFSRLTNTLIYKTGTHGLPSINSLENAVLDGESFSVLDKKVDIEETAYSSGKFQQGIVTIVLKEEESPYT